MNVLVIINDQSYGSERPYNALRLAGALAKSEQVNLRVFLLDDAVACAVVGQKLLNEGQLVDGASERSSATRRSGWCEAAAGCPAVRL